MHVNIDFAKKNVDDRRTMNYLFVICLLSVLRKSCSENMQQIFRRTIMSKCNSNNAALFWRQKND